MRKLATTIVMLLLLVSTALPQGKGHTQSHKHPKTWNVGELDSIDRKGARLYEYRISFPDDLDVFVGQSSTPLQLVKGASIKFSVVDYTIFIVDRHGRVRTLRYTKHESTSPPPVNLPTPPPPIKLPTPSPANL